jgi:hypothetical protein
MERTVLCVTRGGVIACVLVLSFLYAPQLFTLVLCARGLCCGLVWSSPFQQQATLSLTCRDLPTSPLPPPTNTNTDEVVVTLLPRGLCGLLPGRLACLYRPGTAPPVLQPLSTSTRSHHRQHGGWGGGDQAQGQGMGTCRGMG